MNTVTHSPGPLGTADGTPAEPFDPAKAERPVPALMTYYTIVCACTLIGFPIAIWPHYFKFRTLRYRFDDEGISMKWGILWHREIYLTYRRIQDIHVTRNLFQRWLGLASVSVQTASGSSGAEMVIEGLGDPDGLRDFLYTRMRGAKAPLSHSGPRREGHADHAGSSAGVHAGDHVGGGDGDEALALLREIRDELRRVNARRAQGGGA